MPCCTDYLCVGENIGMTDPFEEQEWFKFGVAATLAKQYAGDQREFLELLAQMLERALPDETQIERRGGFFAKKTLHKVIVMLGENRYTLEDPGRGPLLALRTRIVRGIALKTETIPVETWVQDLGAALDERARSSASAREALARLIG
jgi:hypothetical protein